MCFSGNYLHRFNKIYNYVKTSHVSTKLDRFGTSKIGKSPLNTVYWTLNCSQEYENKRGDPSKQSVMRTFFSMMCMFS